MIVKVLADHSHSQTNTQRPSNSLLSVLHGQQHAFSIWPHTDISTPPPSAHPQHTPSPPAHRETQQLSTHTRTSSYSLTKAMDQLHYPHTTRPQKYNMYHTFYNHKETSFSFFTITLHPSYHGRTTDQYRYIWDADCTTAHMNEVPAVD